MPTASLQYPTAVTFHPEGSAKAGTELAITSHQFRMRVRLPAARCARVVLERYALGKQRAWGMPGARRTRSLACNVKKTRVSHHGRTGTPGIPARNGFNGFLLFF